MEVLTEHLKLIPGKHFYSKIVSAGTLDIAFRTGFGENDEKLDPPQLILLLGRTDVQ